MKRNETPSETEEQTLADTHRLCGGVFRESKSLLSLLYAKAGPEKEVICPKSQQNGNSI